ncbi:hypothetical protein DM02DRAFT_724763 [Periconia macrospinosa]|uniref:Uncharacterized protein n=1 Tax=Periconia macrospinosa TaxID=97972 RepID=A0A2V1E689_9PLEO|nr:hypothetical protein DM02DRAFT_724763 [Periconia macrospinosa]
MSRCITDPETGIEECTDAPISPDQAPAGPESPPEPTETLMNPPTPRQTGAKGLDNWENAPGIWGGGVASSVLEPLLPSTTAITNDGGGMASQTPASSSGPIPSTSVSATSTPGSTQNTNHEPVNSPSPSSSASSSPPTIVNQGVAPGAVAGIAIATTILGAAIAFIAAFFIFKRRQNARQAYKDSRVSTPELIASLKVGANHKSYVSISQSITKPPVVAHSGSESTKGDLDLANLAHSSDFLATILPAAADENTVKNKCANLFSQILRHVEIYYRDVHATMTPSMENDLERFGSESLNMVNMLQDSSMPTIAIKHALSGFIMSIVSPDGEEQATLFPTEIAGLKKNERLADTTDDEAAYIMYKRLAVHLHSPDTASFQARQSDIREAAEHFALTFFPWINPAVSDQEKDQELIKIMNSALELSIWLYGQPYQYEFMWEDPGFRGTAITPGLTRMTDSRGRKVVPPHVLLEPIVVAC